MWKYSAALALLFVVPGALAATFAEDFEGFNLVGLNPELSPDQDWYNFARSGDIGNVSADQGVGGDGIKSFLLDGAKGLSAGDSRATFTFENPDQADSTTFWVEAVPIATDPEGSQASITLFSRGPVRRIVEFYIFCDDPDLPDGCALNVRNNPAFTQGEELVPASLNQSVFKIHMVFDWRLGGYYLFVDDIDDGFFRFLDLPTNFAGIELGKVRSDYRVGLYFDNWTVVGLPAEGAQAVLGDVADGLVSFVEDAGFRTTNSKFVMGIAIMGILLAAAATVAFTFARKPLATPMLLMFGVAVALWLTFILIWPVWIEILMIILSATVASGLVRTYVVGQKNTASSLGIILGAVTYFLAASSLLVLAGFNAQNFEVPQNAPDEDGAAEQGIVAQTLECAWGIVTFSMTCGKEVETKLFKVITDALNWGRAAINFLFNILTFQLPIPTILNVLIVLPPAATIFVEAVRIIRG